MHKWIIQAYKAKPHELKNRTKHPQQRDSFCRICGKPIKSMKYCQGCAEFMRHKQREEKDEKR